MPHQNVTGEDTTPSTPLRHPPSRQMKAPSARRREGRTAGRERSTSPHVLQILLLIFCCCIPTQWLRANSNLLVEAEIVGVGDFVSTEECYPPLLSSDYNSDRELNSTEFIDFMNDLGNGIYNIPLDIEKAPNDVNFTFTFLSCLCIRFGQPTSCCNEDVRHIPNRGAAIDEIPNNEQELYLYEICVEAFILKERLTQDLVPTLSPTPLPSADPTNPPTPLPSAQPTLLPSFVPISDPTTAPTDAPVITSIPTAVPTTPFPSDSPSQLPTSEPTISPSIVPTDLPTPDPSVIPSTAPLTTPTATPTIAPSVGPTTSQPTGAPNDTPVIPPTAAPSIGPVAIPTDAPSTNPPTVVPITPAPTSVPATAEPTSAPITPAPTTLTAKPTTSPEPTISPPLVVPLPFFISNNGNFDSAAIMNSQGNSIRQDLARASSLVAQEIIESVRVRRELQLRRGARTEFASHSHRKLQATFDATNNGATIDEVDDGECPPVDAVPEGSICQNVTAGAPLFVGDSVDPDEVGSDFAAAFDEAVADGRLYSKLQEVNPNTPVDFIGSLSGPDVGGPSPTPVSPESVDQDDGLGIGAIVAIAAIALGVSAATGLFLRRRSQQKKDDDLGNGAAPELDDEFGPSSVLGSRQSSTDFPDDLRNFGPNNSRRDADLLGATTPNYGRRKEPELLPVPSLATLDADDLGPRDDREGEDLSTSSPAGSSGWSSNKSGVSSLQTYEDEKDLPAPALKELGAASGVASRLDEKNRVSLVGLEDAPISIEGSEHDLSAVHDNDLDSVPSLPSVSRADLDSAIEAGDWAAVGATAAMLARASDQPSFHSRASSSEGMSRGTSVSSMDAQRAAELDHLVDNGDWEGVVLAAQKFEATGSGSRSNTSGARTDPSEPSAGGGGAENAAVDMSHSSEAPEEPSRSSTDRSTGTSSAYTPSASTSVSESASKAQKRAEVRSEIEALVRRVVPEEIEHIDEMMRQFQGREEELVETLRTMQERSIAQRARAAVHKTAKREARKARSEANLLKNTGSTQPYAAAALPPRPASAVDTGGSAGGQQKANLKTGDEGDANAEVPFDGRTPSMRKLDNALESGDWEAVGAAAGMLDDASVTTMSSDEAQELNENDESSAGDARDSQEFDGAVSAQRAAEMEKMIDLGDWEGVVEAASRLTTQEAQDAKSPPTVPTPPAGESSDGGETSPTIQQPGEISSRARLKPVPKKDRPSRMASQEEQDALAQAEMWRAIAEQSKQEGSHTAKGASDAAEWAISRSLSVLQSAEQKGQLAAGSSGQLDVDSTAESVDTSRGDKSV